MQKTLTVMQKENQAIPITSREICTQRKVKYVIMEKKV